MVSFFLLKKHPIKSRNAVKARLIWPQSELVDHLGNLATGDSSGQKWTKRKKQDSAKLAL
jgi:hypothetical protein